MRAGIANRGQYMRTKNSPDRAPWNKEPWNQEAQSAWWDKAQDTDYPLWMRIGWAVRARHRKNGIAEFEPGELMSLVKASDITQLSRALNRAKVKELVMPDSTPTRLVAPWDVQGGM